MCIWCKLCRLSLHFPNISIAQHWWVTWIHQLQITIQCHIFQMTWVFFFQFNQVIALFNVFTWLNWNGQNQSFGCPLTLLYLFGRLKCVSADSTSVSSCFSIDFSWEDSLSERHLYFNAFLFGILIFLIATPCKLFSFYLAGQPMTGFPLGFTFFREDIFPSQLS